MAASGMSPAPSWALLTDLYELTMAFGYWRSGRAEREAVFHVTFRENPFGHPFSLACGLAHAVSMLENFHFGPDECAYLRSLVGADGGPLWDEPFLQYLGRLRLTVDIDAVPEGTVVFPHEPLVRVQGPLLQAQLLESILLNVINFQTLVATKAERICHAAGEGRVIEFGLRRAQGESGALAASRAAYIGGCEGTSNVLAGRLWGIPVRGTHAHSWVMSFEDELAAFAAYAEALPNNCTFLVDTYDTQRGLENAIRVALQLRARGHRLLGVRLDSGDLLTLSKLARQMLDAAGLSQAVVVASNELDEYQIAALRAQGARIDVWGVGTRLVTAYDQPALGGVYKLGALRNERGQWDYRLKMSEQPLKTSTPGVQQVRRFRQGSGLLCDMMFDELTGVEEPVEVVVAEGHRVRVPAEASAHDLLIPVLRHGQPVYRFPSIHETRQRARQESAEMRSTLGKLPETARYCVGIERGLYALRQRMIQNVGESRS
ncbi:MAG: nicotinate phosphoribosyltransferase [Pirellulaceae bacterium]